MFYYRFQNCHRGQLNFLALPLLLDTYSLIDSCKSSTVPFIWIHAQMLPFPAAMSTSLSVLIAVKLFLFNILIPVCGCRYFSDRKPCPTAVTACYLDITTENNAAARSTFGFVTNVNRGCSFVKLCFNTPQRWWRENYIFTI